MWYNIAPFCRKPEASEGGTGLWFINFNWDFKEECVYFSISDGLGRFLLDNDVKREGVDAQSEKWRQIEKVMKMERVIKLDGFTYHDHWLHLLAQEGKRIAYLRDGFYKSLLCTNRVVWDDNKQFKRFTFAVAEIISGGRWKERSPNEKIINFVM